MDEILNKCRFHLTLKMQLSDANSYPASFKESGIEVAVSAQPPFVKERQFLVRHMLIGL